MTFRSARLDSDIAEHRKREELRKRVQKLLDKWQPILGVNIREAHVRKMKSYWGSVNERDGRMWVSLDLAHESPKHLEYVVVHELVHLMSDVACRKSKSSTCGGHDDKFYELMDKHLPGWRKIHAEFAGPMTQHS